MSLSRALWSLVLSVSASSPITAADAITNSWQKEVGYRWKFLATRAMTNRSGFQLIAPAQSGIIFTNSLSEADGAANRTLYNGSGVATGDVDGDGRPDIFLANLNGENRLYQNLGAGRFTNITASSGLTRPVPQTRGAVLADLNGDGSLDLLLAVNGRGVLCFTNDGHGRFTDATAAAGTASSLGATSLALADVDGNGTLDLYAVNYRTEDIRDRGRVRISMVNGRPILRGSESNRFVMLNGRLEETGHPDQLFLNDGKAHFSPVSWTGGAFVDAQGKLLSEPPLDWGLAAGFRDLNGDGTPDLYVCNDYWTVDRLWWNDGHGHFRAADLIQIRKFSSSSMGVAFGDIDRDGQTDFFVVDMLSRDPRLRKRQRWASQPMPAATVEERPQVMRNTLFLNRGAGRFAEIAPFAGVSASDWSWSPIFLDVDLDGYEDLLIGAGHFRDVQDSDAEARISAKQRNWDGFPNDAERQRAFTAELQEHYHLYPHLDLPVVAYHNRGDTTFEEVTDAWGLNHPAIHHGMAVADFDGDGIRDVVVNVLNGPAQLYHGESTGRPVVVRLRGRPPNTAGIGARITLSGGAVAEQSTEMAAGGGYESGSDPEVVLAGSDRESAMSLRVEWRQGGRSEITGIKAGRMYEIEEPASTTASPRKIAVESTTSPWFVDVSSRLNHRHAESAFNDFDQQPLLPFKLSGSGPAVAWVDLDDDGQEDLIIGGALGQPPAVLKNTGTEPWKPWPGMETRGSADDITGLAIWPGAPGLSVIWGIARYENRKAGGLRGFQSSRDGLRAAAGLPTYTNGVSVVALADLSGEGEWVLFAGGGAQPGAYPRGQPSELFRWNGANWQWTADVRCRGVLPSEGRVTGAVWTDLTGDGRPELVLATEWGPVRAFQDRADGLFDITAEVGLLPYTGWWRGLAVGDFNGDGRMDLVAGNWGLNSAYRATSSAPLVLAYGETSQPGITDLFETEWVNGRLALRRPWATIAAAVPHIAERFQSVAAYSESTLEAALGERAPLTRRLQVTTLESYVFLNLGTVFEAHRLPREVQFAPVNAITVADFDGDGFEDLFLGQNDFTQPAEEFRVDAGMGLWLRGDGKGGFQPVPAAESGIAVTGEQRGCAAADFDNDGKADLVITQNNGPTRLLQNQRGKAGLRVRLQGPITNSRGVGAQLRIRTTAGLGPARELHAGSGSGSQDSLTSVLTSPGIPQAVWVRWPGGKITETPVPVAARSLVIDASGKAISGN